MSIGWNRGLVVGGRSICEEFDLKGLCSAIQFNCPIISMKAIHPKLLTCRRNCNFYYFHCDDKMSPQLHNNSPSDPKIQNNVVL